jgi:DNA-binding transcriptional LysR family regulator
MPNIVRLRYLYESARLGTMHAAGDSLDVATSSVSRQIAQLEQELGLPLIEKGRRGVKLTEAGEAACAHYKEKLSQEEAFLSHIEAMKKARSGKIALAVGEAFVTQRFSNMLSDFMSEYPDMEIHVSVSNTARVSTQILDDEAHLGLIFDIPREPNISARMTVSQPLKLVVGRDHPLSSAASVDLVAISAENLALPDDSYRMRQIIRAAEQEAHTYLDPSLTINSLTFLRDFVLSGRGVSILPELAVQDGLGDGSLRAVSISNELLNGTKTSLITRSGRQLPIGAYLLISSLEAYLRQSPDETADH